MALRARDLNVSEAHAKNRLAMTRSKGPALAEIGNKVGHAPKVTVPRSKLQQKLQTEPVKQNEKDEISKITKVLKTTSIIETDTQTPLKTKSTQEFDTEDIPFSLKRLGIEDIDEKAANDPIFLGEYAKELFHYLRKLEIKHSLKPGFLRGTVTPRMRMVLVDWLFDVQLEFALLQETLFLGIAILDRYLQKVQVIEKKKVQLVGATALYIANKFEETYAPDVSHFVYICSNLYTKHDFLEMEIRILKTLNYFVGFPLPLHFLRRYSKAICPEDHTYTLAKYFQEICLLEYDICHYRPSRMAAGAIYLALWLHKSDGAWSPTLFHYARCKLEDVKEIVLKIAQALVNMENTQFQALFKKYASSKFMKVSRLPEVSAASMRQTIKKLKMLWSAVPDAS